MEGLQIESETGHAADPVVALVALARAGDRAAFGSLFEALSPMVHAILISMVQPAEADDLVQEVFLTALRRLGALRDDAAFAPWLATIARNRARDVLRRRKRTQSLEIDVPVESPPFAEAREALAMIQELPLAYREPLLLRLVSGLSGPEIASRTGLTPGSVRVNLHRGMKLLKERLGQEPGR